MKNFFEVLGLIAGFIGLRLAHLTGWLIRLAVLAAILIGVGTDLLDFAPKVWPPFELGFDTLLAYGKLGFSTAANAWWILALILVLVRTEGNRADIREIESHVTQSKIALVALANYFEIEVETATTKILREKGIKALLRYRKQYFLPSLISGDDFDDALTAKPTRDDIAVSFRDDVKQIFEEIGAAHT